MDPVDREILVLRHFEQLNNVDSSKVLGISESAASRRYAAALDRIGELLAPEDESSG